jgi:hypothetical protein
VLNAATASLFCSFVARNGTATTPFALAPAPASPPSPPGQRSSTAEAAISAKGPDSAWDRVAVANKALNPMLPEKGSNLLSMFKVKGLARRLITRMYAAS